VKVGNYAEVRLCVGENGELRDLRVARTDLMQREGEGGFNGEGLAGAAEWVGGGECVGVFLPEHNRLSMSVYLTR